MLSNLASVSNPKFNQYLYYLGEVFQNRKNIYFLQKILNIIVASSLAPLKWSFYAQSDICKLVLGLKEQQADRHLGSTGCGVSS